jgi:predicted amino acid racemase/arginase family enzyme
MSGPQITIDLSRIERNARAVVGRCAQSGIQVFGVTKGTCGMPQVARAMLRGGVVGLAESRFENIRRLRDSGISCPIMLLRSPPLSRAEEVVRTVDISLQSELAIIRELSRIAERLARVHDIILMIDLGDLREGIWPNDLLPTIEQILKLRGVRVAGVGTNLSCLGAILPTEENLSQLEGHAYKVERVTGLRLDWVSGGNSSSLPLLLTGRMPKGINNLRIGEAILQGGRDTFLDQPWDELDTNAFRLSGELLEVKTKPSMPIGKSGVDAFGQKPHFVDEGDRLRAIANIGREDVIVEGMTPVNPGVRVIGASSDHLVLDITDAAPPLTVGDRVDFSLTYGAMLAVMTSEYVEKAPMHDADVAPAQKRAAIITTPNSAKVLEAQSLAKKLQAIGFEVSSKASSGAIALFAGEDRGVVGHALQWAADEKDEIGLIWIDSHVELAVLRQALDHLPSHLSPENVVLVGLREASAEEAEFLKSSRITVFTMVEIDATGIREVMREAIRIASAGTKGLHISYSPTVTEIPGSIEGSGGITVRETHQVMEAIATSGKMISMDVSPLPPTADARVAATTTHFILSAFGKRIL